MKKIMFNDRYGLTKAVLNGTKTMTRRIIPEIWVDFPRSGRQKANIRGLHSQVLMMDFSHVLGEDCLYPADSKYQPKYYKGDKVAVAQAYKNAIHPLDWVNRTIYQDTPGWDNKLFVRANLMPHRIRITNIKLERLQDISDEDCMKEGIMEGEFMNTWDTFYFDIWGDVPNHKTFKAPRAAFAYLIDRISGKGTWERNPYVYVYEFELIK